MLLLLLLLFVVVVLVVAAVVAVVALLVVVVLVVVGVVLILLWLFIVGQVHFNPPAPVHLVSKIWGFFNFGLFLLNTLSNPDLLKRA